MITVGETDENLSRYLTEIRKYEPLSKEEEKVLIIDIQATGNPRALDKLVKANLKFVVSMAKQYQGQGVTLMDLISQGNAGLLEAINRFDTSRDLKFFSYAVWWISLSLFKTLYNDARTIKIPDNRALLVSRVKREIQILEQKIQHQPSLDELFDFLKETYTDPKDLVIKKLKKEHLYEAVTLSSKQKSIQDKISSDEDTDTLEDILPGNDSIDENMKSESLLQDLQGYYYQLPQSQYDMLVFSLGLNGESCLKPHDLAVLFISVLYPNAKPAEFNRLVRLKEKDVTKLKNQAVKRLRKLKNVNLLRTYL